MKTLISKITLMSLALVLIFISTVALSASHSNPYLSESYYQMESNYFTEYFSYEKMNQTLDLQLIAEVGVKIFNSRDQLIATGSENDDKVKELVKISDLLIDINGTKYYRLSY
jgi:hypothetical protein